MSRLSMNELTTYRWSLEEDIHAYISAGYQAIGVWRQKVEDFGEDAAVDLLSQSGLAVSNLLWCGGFTGSDGRSFQESVDDALSAVRLSAALNAGSLVVYSGGRNHHTLRHARRLFRMALDDLIPLAEAADVTLAIETMHPACAAEWTYLTELDAALDLVAEINSPALKLVVDTYHSCDAIAKHPRLETLVPHIAIVHLSDRFCPPDINHDRCRLGTGTLEIGEAVHALIDAGYQGDFDIELFGEDIETRCYYRLLDESREAFDAIFATAGRL